MEEHKTSIRFFNDREVRAVWDDTHNKWWFSVLDIIVAINEQDDYQKTRNYWKYLKTKLRKENSQLVSATNQLKLKASDGKSYKTDTFDAKGVTLLAKHINNTKATNFLDWFHYSYNGSVLKPSCKSILLNTQFHKYLLPLHHEESPIITLHLSRCTCRLL